MACVPEPLLEGRVAGRHLAAEGWLLPAGRSVRLPEELTEVTLVSVPEDCQPARVVPVEGPLRNEGPCRLYAVDPRQPSERNQPDVVLITVDTLRADYLSASPPLQAFAEANLSFTHARVGSPWTYPSVVALLTGRDLEHRTPHNGIAVVPDTLAAELNRAGYRTVAFVSNPLLMANVGLEAGFDRYELVENDQEVVERALAELASPGPARFVYAHIMGGHMPYSSGESVFRDREGARKGHHDHDQDRIKGLYKATVQRQCALLEPLLDAAPVVALVADHGEELWDHGGFEHGHAFWEELLRVPFVLKAPGLEPAQDPRPARIQDLAPTLLGLLGRTAPETWLGVDLLRKDPGTLWARHLIIEGPYRRAVVNGGWKLIQGPQAELLVDLSTGHPAENPEQRDRLAALERPRSDLMPSPPRPNVDHDQVLHLRMGGQGTVTLSIEAESTLAFSIHTPPRVCGGVRSSLEGYRVEVELDVSPSACELVFAPLNPSDEVTVRAWNEAGILPVERVDTAPARPPLDGDLTVRVGKGNAWHADLSELRALGYLQ